MKALKKTALLGSLAAAFFAGAVASASAADIMRVQEARPNAPFVAIAGVPPGYTTYYISGTTAKPKTPAANGKPADWAIPPIRPSPRWTTSPPSWPSPG